MHSKFDLSNESDRQRVGGEKLPIAQLIQLIERILFSLSTYHSIYEWNNFIGVFVTLNIDILFVASVFTRNEKCRK